MKILCKNKYWQLNKDYNLNKILYLLIDRPDYINSLNSFYWYNDNNRLHRNYNLPCWINTSGHLNF